MSTRFRNRAARIDYDRRNRITILGKTYVLQKFSTDDLSREIVVFVEDTDG